MISKVLALHLSIFEKDITLKVPSQTKFYLPPDEANAAQAPRAARARPRPGPRNGVYREPFRAENRW